jgi:hypothetical protein
MSVLPDDDLRPSYPIIMPMIAMPAASRREHFGLESKQVIAGASCTVGNESFASISCDPARVNEVGRPLLAVVCRALLPDKGAHPWEAFAAA